MASSCLGDRKQVQDARFDSHLAGVKKNVEVNIESSTISFERRQIKISCLVEFPVPVLFVLYCL